MKVFLKIIFVIAIMFGISFTVLSNIGGDSDILKGALEDYASDVLKGQTTISTLHDMQFFPEIIIDVGGIRSVRGGVGDFEIERAQMSIGFFDIMFSSREISVFNIQNIRSPAGFLTDDDLWIERFGIVDFKAVDTEGDKDPFLLASGTYASHPFEAKAGMRRIGNENPDYKLKKDRSITFKSGDFTFSAQIVSYSEKGLKLDHIVLDLEGYDIDPDAVIDVSPQRTICKTQFESVFEDVRAHGVVQSFMDKFNVSHDEGC